MTEGEEIERKEKLKSKWAQLEVVVGAEKRLALVARKRNWGQVDMRVQVKAGDDYRVRVPTR